MKILITGSRETIGGQKTAMEIYHLLLRAKDKGHEILVGDAEGVDDHVIRYCDDEGIPITVYGAYGRMRRRTSTGSNIVTTGSYLARDDVMARNCDICIAIWNGKSRGTMYTYQKAKAYGKKVYLVRETPTVVCDVCGYEHIVGKCQGR